VFAGSVRLVVLALGVALITGCGGGGSGDSNSSGGGGGAGGTPTQVFLSFVNGTPTTLALKIGSGTFVAQSLTSGKFSFSLPSGSTDFAVAYVCTASMFPTYEDIFELSTADGTSFTLPCPTPYPAQTMGALSGNIDGSAIPGMNTLNLAVTNGSEGFVSGVTSGANFNLNVPAGNDRVLILAYNNLGLQGSSLVGAKSLTNQSVPGVLDGGNQVVLGPADAVVARQPITYANVPGGYGEPVTIGDYIIAASGGGFSFGNYTTDFPVFPAGAAVSGDYYQAFAMAKSSAKPTQMMILGKSFTSAAPLFFNFPPPWSYAGPQPAARPTFDLAYSGFPSKTGTYMAAYTDWTVSTTGIYEIYMVASSNYLKGATTLTVPDLTGLAGFVAPPSSGSNVNWVALIAQDSVGIAMPMSSSATITTVENGGTYTVP
jgi:hypothetical protein